MQLAGKGGPPKPKSSLDDDDYEDEREELPEIEIYESLLRMGYFRAAWALVQDSGELGLVGDGTDEDGWTLPMLVVAAGDWATLEALLAGAANVAAQADDGGTVYHALGYTDEIVPNQVFRRLRAALAEMDIDANTLDEAGLAPLEFAVMVENWTAVAQLIDAGADSSLIDLDEKVLAESLAKNGFPDQAAKVRPKSRPNRKRKQGTRRLSNAKST